MSSNVIKKTLNLHKYSVRVNDFMLNWKIIIPIIFSVAGLLCGCVAARGESGLYLKITEYFSAEILPQKLTSLLPFFLRLLIVPSVLSVLLFFLGLSAWGGFVSNLIPLIFNYAVGMISYYMYLNYTLKGLAYCVILVFPYAVLSLTSLILCAGESISMSELMLKNLSKSKKLSDYSFREYYKQYLRHYTFILFACGAKILLQYLFGVLFLF